MPVGRPELHLDDIEAALLSLLVELLNERSFSTLRNYSSADSICLSPRESASLAELIPQWISTRRFLERAYFVEQITRGDVADLDRMREIYLSNRAKRGRSRAMATTHWNAFLQRYGHIGRHPVYFKPTVSEPMPLSQFFKMEATLFVELGFNPGAREVLLSFVESQRSNVSAIRAGERKLRSGDVRAAGSRIIRDLDENPWMVTEGGNVPLGKITQLATLVSDGVVMFTTRDWGITGTLSTIAAAAAAFLE